ncbi:MAG: DUF1294 domain-containing protein [Pseudomonadota bacterium]
MLPLIAAIITVANVAGAALFWYDKQAAMTGRWRIPERTLLGTAALGAAPLLVVLSNRLRHKTQKQPFRMRLVAMAIIEGAIVMLLVLGWLI